MVALWIVLGILLLLFLLLVSRVSLFLRYDGKLTVRAGLWFLVIRLFPRKKKKRKKPNLRRFSAKNYAAFLEKERRKAEKKAAKQAKKDAERRAEKDENPVPVGEKIESVLSLVTVGIKELSTLSRRITTDVRLLSVTVSAEDAATVAERYGAVSAAVSAFLVFLDKHTRLAKRNGNPVRVNADFLSGKTEFLIDFSVKVPLYALLAAAVRFSAAMKQDGDVSTKTQKQSEARNGKHQ